MDEGCVRETKRARVRHDDEESTKTEVDEGRRRGEEHEHGEMGRDRRPGGKSQWKGFITKFHALSGSRGENLSRGVVVKLPTSTAMDSNFDTRAFNTSGVADALPTPA